MESKKRPHSDQEDSVVSKKRILTGANGSPLVNGVTPDEDEPGADENLELFRKEAIYRRMKHYSRENERSQNRIAELERRKTTCEAGLAAMSACWSQLVEAIRLIVKPDELPQVNADAKELFDLSSHIDEESTPELAAALGDTVNATQSLVTKFVQLNGGSQSQLLQETAYVQSQKMQTECAALRSQVNMMRVKLQDCETQRDQYHAALVAAENRLERSQSGTVVAMGAQRPVEKHEVNGEGSEEPQRKPSSPAQTPELPFHGNGIHDPLDLAVLNEMLKSRESKILELEREAALLRDEKNILELELKSPSQERIAENPHYRVLLQHASVLEASVEEKKEHVARISDELYKLQMARKEWEDGVVAASEQANQELKTMLAKRDVDNIRLREQRDQQAAELNERRQKEKEKFASVHEIKFMAESRFDRIIALEYEVRRCKAQLAANAGNAELMHFFLDGNTEIATFIESLKEQKMLAENRVAALEQTFTIYQDDHPNVVQHMKAEADALQKLSETTAELERYRKIYGASSSLPPDVAQLAEHLKQKDEELQKLRLSEEQHVEAEKSLYAELEKLSNAWEALDRQLKGKVFDLTSLEERVAKTGLDKAKSENKFYTAMRDKEAVELERKNLQRNLDKQAKVTDRLLEAEKKLQAQVANLEKEISMHKRRVEYLKENVTKLDGENSDLRSRLDAEKQRAHELFGIVNERERTLSAKKVELRKIEDDLIKSKKELERHAAQLKETSSATIPQKHSDEEPDPELAHLRQILKCSTCRTNFRSVIITKCSHTFCKPCVDARISTRQRKCPACNLAFGQSEVQSLYWQ